MAWGWVRPTRTATSYEERKGPDGRRWTKKRALASTFDCLEGAADPSPVETSRRAGVAVIGVASVEGFHKGPPERKMMVKTERGQGEKFAYNR